MNATSPRDAGIQQSIDHANAVHPKWSDLAYSFLIKYIAGTYEFMVEDVRKAAEGKVPEPPSKRAWGAVVLRAAKNDLIENVGYQQKKNPDAHKTPAVLWRLKDF